MESEVSVFCRAADSSRRMAVHSADFRFECWKRRRRGVERRREVYCLWSCDFRYSGGLWEGGWVRGKRARGGGAVVG